LNFHRLFEFTQNNKPASGKPARSKYYSYILAALIAPEIYIYIYQLAHWRTCSKLLISVEFFSPKLELAQANWRNWRKPS